MAVWIAAASGSILRAVGFFVIFSGALALIFMVTQVRAGIALTSREDVYEEWRQAKGR